MKKYFLFFTFCFTLTITIAQVTPKKIEGKPSYKETVEYIKANLPNQLFTNGLSGDRAGAGGSGFVKDTYKITKLEFDDKCAMSIRYEVKRESRMTSGALIYQKEEFESAFIEFDRVEEINFVHLSGKNGETCVFGLYFKTQNKNEESRIQIPIAILDCATSFDVLKGLQIYKAFEHLRKMCGAPEQIQF